MAVLHIRATIDGGLQCEDLVSRCVHLLGELISERLCGIQLLLEHLRESVTRLRAGLLGNILPTPEFAHPLDERLRDSDHKEGDGAQLRGSGIRPMQKRSKPIKPLEEVLEAYL